MTNLIIGAVVMAGFLLLVNYVRARRLRLAWWHWALIIAGFLYAVFVLEVIVGFLEEGSAQAAVVMGSILGFVAVVWGVLLGRFVIARARKDEAEREI
jgi:hypothetical protein